MAPSPVPASPKLAPKFAIAAIVLRLLLAFPVDTHLDAIASLINADQTFPTVSVRLSY